MSRSLLCRTAVVALPLLALTACGGGSGDAGTASTAATSSTPVASATPSESESPSETAAAGAGADVDLHVTGAKILDVTGHAAAAFCAYYLPTTQEGVSIQATSTDFPGSGTWSMHVQGNDAASVGLLLAIDDAQFSGNNGDDPASADEGGTITVSDDVKNAEFDMQLVNIVNHDQTIKVKGSVRCS
jgi:phage gp45-like